MTNNVSYRSWFCVLNNPQKLFGNIEPEEMVNKAIQLWTDDKPTRTCAINYEIGENGTPHMHMVLEDSSKVRFTAIQKIFPSIHIEPTRGNKKQADDYINKRGDFIEKGTTIVVPPIYHGEIKAQQGKRTDLSLIEELINDGYTPHEIMASNINFRRYEKIIRRTYFDKRIDETPFIRNVIVYWHVGRSGCGKSYTQIQLIEKYGEENIYVMTDYDNGGLDLYEGQKILFMDEFKGNMKFSTLLQILDKYKTQIHCRYSNVFALWTEVHITSVYPPEEAYKFMVDSENQEIDSIKQLLRRITYICYHYKNQNEFCCFTQESKNYKDYETLIAQAHQKTDGFQNLEDDISLPFD